MDFVENEVGKENLLVFLTSNHGSSENHAYLEAYKMPGGEFRYMRALTLLKSYLKALYGDKEWVSFYESQQIYLNHNLIEDSKLNLEEFQDVVANFMLQFSGVANVATSLSFRKTNFSQGAFSKMYNSFNQKRSGDIMIILEPGWIEQTTTEIIGHNSFYNYDTHVPLLWYGWKTIIGTTDDYISIAEIAPTLSGILEIAYPDMASPKTIKGIFSK